MILPLAAVAQTSLTCGEWRAQEPPVGSTRSAIVEDASGENEAWTFAFSLGLVRWDGVDPSGRAMPSGACLVSLRGNGVHGSRQIVLVRRAHDHTEKAGEVHEPRGNPDPGGNGMRYRPMLNL